MIRVTWLIHMYAMTHTVDTHHSPCKHVCTYACTSMYVYVCMCMYVYVSTFTSATHSSQAWPIREMMRSTSAVVRCAIAPLYPANLPKVWSMFRSYVSHSYVQHDSFNVIHSIVVRCANVTHSIVVHCAITPLHERWGAGVEYHFQEFNEPYAPS